MAVVSTQDYENVLSVSAGRRPLATPALDDINSAEVVQEAGAPFLHCGAGQFAIVYRCRPQNAADLALRCLLQPPSQDAADRATAVMQHLMSLPSRLPSFVDYRFVPDAVFAGGEWRAAYLMEWVEGKTLDRTVEELVQRGDAQALRRLADEWVQVVLAMEQAGVAHGDIQHNNVMVNQAGEIRLVDYDSTYVPALQGRSSLIVGVEGYAHPAYLRGKRRPFGPTMDTFSALVILLSLRALASEPSLYRTFTKANLLLGETDLEAPGSSAAFSTLFASADPTVGQLAHTLATYCGDASLAEVPFSQALAACGVADASPPLDLPEIPAPAPPWTPHPLVAPLAPASLSAPILANGLPSLLSTPIMSSSQQNPPAGLAQHLPPLDSGMKRGELNARVLVISIGVTSAAAALLPFSPFRVSGEVGRLIQSLGSIFFNITPEARLILLVAVLPLALVTFIRLWEEHRRLTQEQRVLDSCRENLRKLIRFPVSDQHLQAWLTEADADGALNRAVTAVWNSRSMQTPDLEAISALAGQAEATRASIGRTAANRLLILSLLGTVVGLAGVVSSLQPQVTQALRDADPQSLMGNLGETLDRMGTAFASTAWGIALAGLVAWLSGMVTSQRGKYLADVECFAVGELAPRVMPQSESVQIENLRQLMVHSYAVVEGQVDQLRQLLNGSYTFIQSAESAITNAANNLNGSLDAAGQAVIDGASALKGITDGFSQTVRKSDEKVSRAADKLTLAAQSAQQNFTGFDATVTRLETSLSTQNKHLGDLVAKQQTATEKVIQAQEQRTDALAKTLETRTNALIQIQQQRADALIKAQEAASTQLSSKLDSVLKEIDALLQRTNPNLPAGNEWKEIQKTLSDCATALNTYSRAFEQMQKTSGNAKPPNDHSGTLDTTQLVSAINDLPTRLAPAVGQQVAAVAGQVQQQVRVDLNAIRQDLGRLQQSLGQFTVTAAQRTDARSAPTTPAHPTQQPPFQPTSHQGANGGHGQPVQQPFDPIVQPPPRPAPPSDAPATRQRSEKPKESLFERFFGRKG